MTKIEWSDGFNVGVAEVDEQHRKLVDILNDLSEAMSQGTGKEVVGPILLRLKEYAAFHFVTEERLMERFAFPDRSEHKRIHQQFIRDVTAFDEKYKDGKTSVYDLWVFVQSWLLDHIMGVDVNMGQFLTESGVS